MSSLTCAAIIFVIGLSAGKVSGGRADSAEGSSVVAGGLRELGSPTGGDWTGLPRTALSDPANRASADPPADQDYWHSSLSERDGYEASRNAIATRERLPAPRSENDEVAYWQKLASKRLAGWRHAELQRNHARGQLRKLRQALRASVRLGASGLERGFLCIHSFEGSWTDPNPPHYGGLQFDDSFQRTYGPEFYRAYGTANHWTPSMQMAAAMRAYLAGRGFGPWPNTRKSCGL